jgi:hypothetical protein
VTLRRAVVLACVAALAAACPKQEEAPGRGGLRVPLPPGWVADEGKSGALRAGP